jgi:putative transposase
VLSGRRCRRELAAEQVRQCQGFGDICRAVGNAALDQRREYRKRGAWTNCVAQAAELAEANREHPWLSAAPSHVLQQTLRDLDRACREHGTVTVRWRTKPRWSPSFRVLPSGTSSRCNGLAARGAGGRSLGMGPVPLVGSPSAVRSVRPHWAARAGSGSCPSSWTTGSRRRRGTPRSVSTAVCGEKVRYRRLARQQTGSANRRRTVVAMPDHGPGR